MDTIYNVYTIHILSARQGLLFKKPATSNYATGDISRFLLLFQGAPAVVWVIQHMFVVTFGSVLAHRRRKILGVFGSKILIITQREGGHADSAGCERVGVRDSRPRAALYPYTRTTHTIT